MTEVPEHLLQRSKERRRAMGLAVEGDEAPAAAPAESANAPAVAAAAAPAVKAPVPFPAAEEPPPPPPDSEWVAAAKDRQKVPYWVMPVLLFLPIWLIMYVGTLEEPTREEGVIFEGGEVYEAQCASCHGAGGGGGVGPAFSNGAVIETFNSVEAQVAWIVSGSAGFRDAGRDTYGDTNKPIGGTTGALMPAFGEALTAEEIIAATFYERIELGGQEEELEFAEAAWELLESDELEVPENFIEGEDLDGEMLAEAFDETRSLLADGEVAAG